ncbi:Phytochrome two-component sensor histidine kinase [Paramagnetospirillum magnetotacticum MS-1]|uniref:Phytochrome two-component sensor histidine kinase n=1 Tax=Paramagnetospirillum magnetotacticum MS-1 TaxID=272627 RepID=A0A0C2Z1K7_PARME|nr:GAF domain-containing protein [Paramagnetospirillum magnetotacticum]KIM00791.1 Phytochrome two-component sensor histidine kinase [Paramagnetospirillum magnetotacticum MS-1]
MVDTGSRSEPGLQGCESERLHLSGEIQPFGALLRLDPDGQVSHASANCGAVLGIPPEALLGQIPGPLLGGLVGLDELTPLGGFPILRTKAFTAHGDALDLAVSPSGEGLLLEFEPTGDFSGTHSLKLKSLEAIHLLHSPTVREQPNASFQILTETIADLTGYGRVLIYRFADDWSGEVVAETLRRPMQSYQGLHFPAADIPVIARDLYTLNRQRYIRDALAGSVPILGCDPADGAPDQTFGDLRSVSPMHLTYLGNMGVRASFSASILMRGKLWGLIACHHPEPKPLSLDVRQQLVKIARDFSVGLLVYIASIHLKFIDGIQREVRTMLDSAGHLDLTQGLVRCQDRFLALVGADSAAILTDDSVIRLGDAPATDDLALIDHWFDSQDGKGFASTAHLAAQIPEAETFRAQASGVIALRVRLAWLSGSSLRLFWFRREWPHLVQWAGDPTKPGGSGGVLTPRQSFTTWSELARGRARPWELPDLLAAKTLRACLCSLKVPAA